MSTDEATQKALNEVDHLVEELDLPSGVDQIATVIVQQWGEMNRLQSRPIVVNAAAAVVVACKANALPYTTRDVGAKVSEEVDVKYIGRAETDMISELGDQLGLDLKPTLPQDYVDRFCQDVGLADEELEEVKEMAQKVLTVAQEGDPNLFSGRSPSAGAAAAIWIAARLSGHSVTQSMMAEVGETTTVTIRDMANSIIIGIFQSDTDIEEMATTDTLDARLNQRIQQSRQQLEA